MSLDEAAWAEIARLWRESSEPVSRIGARFGVSHQKIVARARQALWPPRAGSSECGALNEMPGAVGSAAATLHDHDTGRATRGRSGLPSERAAVECTPAGRLRSKQDRSAARRAMVERLFDAMDKKLSAIERRIEGGGDATPADSERTTRALNTLVRSLEKLADYEGKISNAKVAGRKNGKRRKDADDPERRRHELAGRIERLLKRS